MPWVRLEDHFDEHPKLARVGPLGLALWVTGLAYCNRNLTDGHIPWSVARSLVAWEFLGVPSDDGRATRYTVGVTSGMSGEDVTGAFVVGLLVDAGLWEETPDGYRVHDYHDYQPSREQIETERSHLYEVRSAAGRRGGQRSGESRRSKIEAKRTDGFGVSPDGGPDAGVESGEIEAKWAIQSQNGSKPEAKHEANHQAKHKQNGSPVPVPLIGGRPSEPHQEQETVVHDKHMAILRSPCAGSEPTKRVRASYGDDFEAWWRAYPRHDSSKKVAGERYEQRRRAGRSAEALLASAEHMARYHDEHFTPTDKIPHATTFLHQHRDEVWEHGPPDAGRVVAAPAVNGHRRANAFDQIDLAVARIKGEL